MREVDVLNDLAQIDGLLAKCVNPALTRNEHDSIRQVMSVVVQRVKLSFKLEKEMQESKESKKEPEAVKDEGK